MHIIQVLVVLCIDCLMCVCVWQMNPDFGERLKKVRQHNQKIRDQDC